MNDKAENELEVGAVKHGGHIKWFRMERSSWVLDWHKWENDLELGEAAATDSDDAWVDRDIPQVINETTLEQFLNGAARFDVSIDQLKNELTKRFPTAKSFWDVADLFPVVFVDFDRQHVGAFYLAGIQLEVYIPDGWTGEFVDFANDYDATIFPPSDKFWIVDGVDLLAELNRRGSELASADTHKIKIGIR